MEEQNTEVVADNPMKSWLVDYVGQNYKPEKGEVTVELIVEALAQEFPDFVLVLAQENFIRGYQQALYDVDYGELRKNEEQPEPV
jgi:hypothetical protein